MISKTITNNNMI